MTGMNNSIYRTNTVRDPEHLIILNVSRKQYKVQYWDRQCVLQNVFLLIDNINSFSLLPVILCQHLTKQRQASRYSMHDIIYATGVDNKNAIISRRRSVSESNKDREAQA